MFKIENNKVKIDIKNLPPDFKIISDMLQLRRGEIIIDNSLNMPIFHIKSVSLYGYNFYFNRNNIYNKLVSLLS